MSTQWSDKKFGFGLMRLPRENQEIAIPGVCELVDEFMKRGFTYFDTAYVYGGSEAAFREAVVKRYPRESYTITSKMAGWLLTDDYTADDMLNEQLKRAGVEYFDYYMLHSIQPSRKAIYDAKNCWEFLQQKKAEGKIRACGFSFHGKPDLLDEILTAHPELDFVQLQLNYMDWDDHEIICARDNYEVARKHGKDIIVMEPVKGGILADLRPECEAKLRALSPEASPASYALRFVGSLPGVRMVLSGMNTPEQMADNLSVFENFKPITEEETEVLREIVKMVNDRPGIPCTNCRYCVNGCPMNINIPEIFKLYNAYLTFGEHTRPHLNYNELRSQGYGRVSDCLACGQCEAACPQHIEIAEQLKKCAPYFDNN